ncbi:MAG: glycine--tRNA ligase subunit beta [Pseudomonadota bacterium]
MPDLLLELFSEEIPARMQARAAADLKRLVTDRLVEAGLTYSAAAAFATPRRLTLSLTNLPAETRATREERKGPRTDAPEKAIEGFLRSTGLAREALEIRDDKKGQVYFATIERPGRPATAVVAEAVTATINDFPWPKSMRWGEGSLRWVRPLRRILCLLSSDAGSEIVPVEAGGIAASNVTEGHRFLGSGPFEVTDFEDYAAKLEAEHVILNAEDRAERIWHDATQAAFALGLEVVEDKGLLAEVAGLVEWPVVLMGEIGADFLGLPPEVLQTSMREHQKFFSVRNPKTGRIERFITVANTAAPDGGATILDGNQRVLAARLADAKFFWENDLRKVERQGIEGMEAMAAPLANVVFHETLGTQAERIDRIAALAREIAPALGADPAMVEQAARVAKADLASEMVYEFPELQGVMGGHYARAAGLAEPVAAACEAHYRPLGPADDVPTDPVASSVALADKIDMLTGFFATGHRPLQSEQEWGFEQYKPTGSGDPFALRRAALGLCRNVLQNNVRIRLQPVWKVAYAAHEDRAVSVSNLFIPLREVRDGKSSLRRPITRLLEYPRQLPDETVDTFCFYFEDPQVEIEKTSVRGRAIRLATQSRFMSEVGEFIGDRLKIAFRDEGVRHDVIQACYDLGGQDDLVLLVARVKAVQALLETEDGANLLAAYRRASNIVAAEAKKDGRAFDETPDPAKAVEDAERGLFEVLGAVEPRVAAALEAEDFGAATAAMAALRAPVDAFFDDVTVNTDDAALRENRLRLLNALRALMRRAAAWEAIQD